MTTTCQIPESVRSIFQHDASIDAHAGFFSSPTQHLLGPDAPERIEAVQTLVATQTVSSSPNPAYRFVLEAQLDAIGDVVEGLEQRHPERFRDTERLRDLLENLDILLNGGEFA